MKQLLRKQHWLKTGKNVTRYYSQDVEISNVNTCASPQFAVHVSSRCAERLPRNRNAAVPAGLLPESLQQLLDSGAVWYHPGLRILSAACRAPQTLVDIHKSVDGKTCCSIGDDSSTDKGEEPAVQPAVARRTGDMEVDDVNQKLKQRRIEPARFKFSELFCVRGPYYRHQTQLTRLQLSTRIT